ncbi:MAG TPA: ATP-binding cassette domain-containing protein [Burkholderiales bacterium]|nr:ATP-binding cassette domain-containing protein [Burkholderiales bacterium]
MRSDIRHVLILAAIALAVIAIGPYVLPTYMVNSLIRAFLYASVALTVDILWGYTGILTFGQSAFFGIGAYAAGLIFTHVGFNAGYATLAFFVGVIGAMIVAAIVGWLAFYHGASPLYGSVITLVLPIVVSQILYSGGNFTGSSSGLSGFESFDVTIEAWFWIAGAFLVVVTALAWMFVRSDAGKVLVAIRENEQRCEYVGINVSRVKILLMVVCAAIAAIAGYAFAGVQMVVAPEYAGFVFGTELLIWVALGGRGTLIGPVIGTLVLDVSTSYLSGNLPFVWKLIIGVAFVVVIVALPQGLMPLIRGALSRLRGRRTTKESGAVDVTLVPATEEMFAGLEGAGRHALVAKDVRKHFGSLQVLEGINFNAERGELLSLVGPNGAGKTTLIRCIADGGERSGGTILVNDHDIERLPPYACVAFGVGRKFQTANVFETLTVTQALRIARTRHKRPSLWRRDITLELPQAALQVIRATGIDQRLEIEARYLSHGQKQALELAMVLSLEPSVLLLDEPTAGLTKPERALIGQILAELATAHRLCILLVEHDLDFVREISSRVIVLHQGRIVLDGTVGEVVESDLVRTIYAGGAHA